MQTTIVYKRTFVQHSRQHFNLMYISRNVISRTLLYIKAKRTVPYPLYNSHIPKLRLIEIKFLST